MINKAIILFLILVLNNMNMNGSGYEPSNIDLLKDSLKNAPTIKLKNDYTIKIIDEYIFDDKLDSAELYLYLLIDQSKFEKDKYLEYTIYIKQTEIYYFENLTEFGKSAVYKSLEEANKINDSLLIANSYAFLSYLYEEIDSFYESKKYMHTAIFYYLNSSKKGHYNTVEYSQMISQLAQMTFQLGEYDSSLYYNNIAYKQAIAEHQMRAQAMCFITFGNIYYHKNNLDSANYYYNKCNDWALKYNLNDILLWNKGKLLKAYSNNKTVQDKIYNDCIEILNSKNIGQYYLQLFFSEAILVYKKSNDIQKLIFLQEQLISTQKNIAQSGNKKIQKIAQQYVDNENKILKLELNEVSSKRRITTFQLLFIGISLAVIFIIYYYQTQKKQDALKKKIDQQSMISNERDRISQDMHDNLGSGLTSIFYLANTVDKEKFSKIKIKTGELIQNLSEIVWAMSDDKNNAEETIAFLKRYASEFYQSTNIEISFTSNLKNKNISINSFIRKNLFSIYKEILNNALKYSKATTIKVDINIDKLITLEIKDNGIGIPQEKLSKPSGNGIINIKKRVESLSGTLEIKNENGTYFYISIPISN
jgi:signal transduction histidine kinase